MRREATAETGKRRRGWLGPALAATGLAGVTTGVIAASSTYVVQQLTGIPPVRDGLRMCFTPWEMGVPYEHVSFPAEDGCTLRGWLLARPESHHFIVGLGGYRAHCADLLGVSTALWRAGYNVLLFDYRGHGDSDGRRVTLGHDETSDLHMALGWLRARHPEAWIGLLGYSMGGAVAILGGAAEPAVRAVVTDCAFCYQEEMIRLEWRRRFPLVPSWPVVDIVGALLPRLHGFHFRDVAPLAAVGRIAPRPLLLIHAREDGVVPIGDAYRLYEAAGEPKELWIVPGVPHCGAYFLDRAAYTARVIDFFDRAAGGAPRAARHEQRAMSNDYPVLSAIGQEIDDRRVG